MFNFGLETWANITISVAIWVVGAILLLFVANVIFTCWFKNILKKHEKSLIVALSTKLDNIKSIFAMMKKFGVKIDPKHLDVLNSIKVEDFTNPDSEICKASRDKLTSLRMEAIFITRGEEKLQKNVEFTTLVNNVLETDTVYRNTVACYNADVLGYNYWIKFLPFRWFWKLIKAKAKNLI